MFADEDRDKQVDELAGLDERRPITSFQLVAKSFCAWVRSQLDADLAYLVIYDARFNVFCPIGASISSTIVQRFLKDQKECINLGMPEDQTREDWCDQLWNAYVTSGKEKGGVHGLVEHAIISRLRLRTRLRRKLTWELFNSKKEVYYPDTATAKDKMEKYPLFPEPTKHYAKAILGIPFCHDEHAHADGVLWVCWNRNRPETKQALGEQLSRLQPVLEAIAAVYSIHQYHDPDEALNPLPFRTATPTA